MKFDGFDAINPLQGKFIANDCVCFECQDFRHLTSKCPSKRIFTLVEEKKYTLVVLEKDTVDLYYH